MHDSRLHQVALNMIPGIGNVITRTLISYCGTAENVFNSNKHKLSKIPGIGEKTANSILNFKNFHLAEEEVKKCDSHQIKIIFLTDEKKPCVISLRLGWIF